MIFCDDYNTGDKQTVLVVSDFENVCLYWLALTLILHDFVPRFILYNTVSHAGHTLGVFKSIFDILRTAAHGTTLSHVRFSGH